MDLSNLINNEKIEQVKNQFNSADINLQKISDQKLVDIADCNFVNAQDIQKKQQRQNMLKDMFVLLSNSSDVSYIIRELKIKYGNLVDDKVITCCMKLCDIIGNYLITCRYNDNLGSKNPITIKYVLFCDCGDQDFVKQEIGTGSIDGVFKQNKQVIVPKVKMCKKHHLPVLASIDDLNQKDFNDLVKKVSQVNTVQQKNQVDQQNNKKAKVLTKIANIFRNLRTAKKEKIDNSKHVIKQANTDLMAAVSKKKETVEVTDFKAPKPKDIELKKDKKTKKVNMPTNNITVDVKKKKKSIKSFTIKPNKYNDLQLANVKDNNTTIMAKDMPISVQKQAKYVQNICIKTKPVDEGFDMKDDFVFDIDNNNVDNIVVDTKNDFNF